MAVFPLQEPLINAVVRYAGLEIRSPDDAIACFDGIWRPTDIPTLQTCRRIQRDVRRWIDARDSSAAIATYLPRQNVKPEDYVDSTGARGVKLVGYLGARGGRQVGKHGLEITVHWFIEDAPLRAVCGLAVASIWHAGLQDRVGLCKRKECGNYYLDRNGRSKQYCGEKACDDARNRERVEKSRSKQ